MARIFISYRRDDAGYVASMVRERLEEEFGAGSVFMDIEDIVLGVDFRRQLSDAVSTCDVLVALIGETWAGPLSSGPERRIDNPEDFVRIEIEAALKRGIPVVPVLIDKAQLPPAAALPESLRELAFRHAAELRAGRDLKAHLDTLCQGLRAHLGPPAVAVAAASAAGPAANRPSAAEAPPPRPGTSLPSPPSSPSRPEAQAAAPAPRSPPGASAVWWATGGAALLLAGAAGWWATRPPPLAPTQGPTVAAVAPQPAPRNPAAAPATTPATTTAPAPSAPTTAAPADGEPGSRAADVLRGYKIAIYVPTGDVAAGKTARAIRDLLATRGVERGVEMRLATAEKLRHLVPAESLEVRFDAGREEDQARLLARLLGGQPLRRTPVLKPVPSDEPTPNFISVFVPAGG